MKKAYIQPQTIIIESILEYVINAGSPNTDSEPEAIDEPAAKENDSFIFDDGEGLITQNHSSLWDDDEE